MDRLPLLKTNLFLTLFFSSFCWARAPHSHSLYAGPKLKVLIKKRLPTVEVKGTDLNRTLHAKNHSKVYSGSKSIKFNCRGRKKKKAKQVLLASVGSLTGLVSLKDDKYQGQLHIISSPDRSSCDVINETYLESYISTLLSKEMNAEWPIEALKAQAVAARTYAYHKTLTGKKLRKMGRNVLYDLESSEKNQVSGDFFDITESTSKASRETRGQILTTFTGEVVPIFFHAKCGGKTIMPSRVWENKVIGYKSANCPFCKGRGHKAWKKTITHKRIKKFIGWLKETEEIKIPDVSNFRLAPSAIKSHKINLYFSNKMVEIDKPLLRRFFGRVWVPSNSFKLTQNKSKSWVLHGDGLGHGVGMCQIGALAMAEKGWGYKKILSHYFPRHQLGHIYE